MSSVSLERFISPDYQLTGDVQEIPHIAESGRRLLEHEAQITSTWQLVGEFFCSGANGRDQDEFADFLNGKVAQGHHVAVARAIATRVANVGFALNFAMPTTDKAGKPISTKLDDDKTDRIRGTKFNNDLRHDLPGVGLGREDDKDENKSLVSLRDNGIHNTNHLVGTMLKLFPSPGPPTAAQVLDFRDYLGEIGVASSYKSTIIDALKAKLYIGIDNCVKPRELPSLVEEAADPFTEPRRVPRDAHTATRSRDVNPPRGGPLFGQEPAIAAPIPLVTAPVPVAPAPEAPQRRARPSEQTNQPPASTAIVVGLLAIAWMLFAFSTEKTKELVQG